MVHFMAPVLPPITAAALFATFFSYASIFVVALASLPLFSSLGHSSVVLASAVSIPHTAPTPINNGTITFGYLRMTGIDNKATLAAYLTAIRRANEAKGLSGYRYVLDVTTIDCADDDGCRAALQTSTGRALFDAFAAKMPSFAAVLRPCHIVAPQVIDASLQYANSMNTTSNATAYGADADDSSVPTVIIDAITIRESDYASQHIITFNHHVRDEIARVFTYMQNAYACAVSGVLYDDFSEMPTHVDYTVGLFTGAGMLAPAVLNVGAASAQEIRDFVIREDIHRRCFLVLTTNAVFRRVMTALSGDAEFNSEERRMYGISLMGADHFNIDGDATPFAHTSFVRWFPTLDATEMVEATNADADLAAWRAGMSPAEVALFTDYGLTVPLAATDFTLQGLLVMEFLIETVHNTITRQFSAANASNAVPFLRALLLDTLYGNALTVGGYPFSQPVRSCPPKPLKQLCFCNTLTLTSYLYAVNASTALGSTYIVHDDASEGQRDVSSVALPSPCGTTASGWAYPITGMFLIPRDFAARVGLSAAEVRTVYEITSRSFGSLMRDINYAPVAPARPYRYVTVMDAEGVEAGATAEAIFQYEESYRPFVVLGGMSERIGTSPILTLFPSLIEIENEDPVLVPHDQWQWQVINLRPVMADLVHALASFYGGAAGHQFTSFNAITATNKGAEMVHKSFATFGFDVPISSITTTEDPLQWAALVSQWLTDPSSSRPFVIAVAGYNPNNCVGAAYRAASNISRGTLALAVTEAIFYNAFVTYPLPAEGEGSSDIIFPTFMIEWWTKSTAHVPADMLAHTRNPRYHIAAAAVEFTRRLGNTVQYDYSSTAADALYSIQTVSAENIVYGPFTNVSCSAEEIAGNVVDRRCQCTKGIRAVFVHSAYSFRDDVLSTRTNRYKYTMTTCGVEYKPYVPPAIPFELSNGAIAGIAVGCSVAVISLIVAAVLVNYFCIGRNNRAAPKDGSKPFAIVFTDIQSSTALWARAPTAMSDAIEEHHRILRRLLRRNDGYEVKTVGDSFMIAFKEADDAVLFSLEAQIALHRGDWCDEIDAIYIELLAEQGINNDDLNANNNNPKLIGLGVAGSDDDHVIAGQVSRSDIGAGTAPSVAGTIMSLQSATQFAQHHHRQHQHQQHTSSTVVVAMGQNDTSFDKAADYLDVPSPGTGADAMRKNNIDNNNNNLLPTPLPPRHSVAEHSTAVYQPTANETTAAATTPSNAHTVDSSGIYRAGKMVANPWHGVRVRIGVHYGLGEIRKDPVSLGYDYYGTVVNTAARVEGVGHGGQILLTDEAFEALSDGFAREKKAVVIALGPQPLRGLDAPIKLHQLVPASLEARRFPALRLHIEKETEESELTDGTVGTGTSDLEAPEDIVARVCAGKAYSAVPPESLLLYYHYVSALLGPASEKYRVGVLTHLAESWGFEQAARSSRSEGARRRLMVSLLAKVTRAFGSTNANATGRRRGSVSKGSSGGGGAVGAGGGGQHTNSNGMPVYGVHRSIGSEGSSSQQHKSSSFEAIYNSGGVNNTTTNASGGAYGGLFGGGQSPNGGGITTSSSVFNQRSSEAHTVTSFVVPPNNFNGIPLLHHSNNNQHQNAAVLHTVSGNAVVPFNDHLSNTPMPIAEFSRPLHMSGGGGAAAGGMMELSSSAVGLSMPPAVILPIAGHNGAPLPPSASSHGDDHVDATADTANASLQRLLHSPREGAGTNSNPNADGPVGNQVLTLPTALNGLCHKGNC